MRYNFVIAFLSLSREEEIISKEIANTDQPPRRDLLLK